MAQGNWGIERVAGARSEALTLTDTEIHIWQANLMLSSYEREQFAKTLSADEQARANRFRFLQDTHRFVVSRGILRALLGQYLQIDPAQIAFGYSERGKPSLANAQATAGLVFNLSHSEDFMVCAIARQGCVGIDLEYIRPITDLEDLTKRFFSPQEHTAIHALSGEARLRSFFQHWTCKEALLKATGDGLISLSAIRVSIEDNRAQLLSWQSATHPGKQWSLHLFEPASGYVAAIAMDAPHHSITFCQWNSIEHP
ncbi:MAG: 4'-phosphopantetheinyl transferase superfamily protein [Leptolyngbya sp. BL-A-14]